LAGGVLAAGLWHLMNVDAKTEVLRPCQNSRAMVAPATYGFIGLTEWGFIDSDVVTNNTRR
jgi:hypothetical protein